MPVQFKFRGEKVFRSLINVTTPCTLHRVKNAIYDQARISDQTTDLFLEDSITGDALDGQVLLVPDALVQVVVRRTPAQNRGQGGSMSLVAPILDDATPTLHSLRSEEDLAIDRVVEQHDVATGSLGMSSDRGNVLKYSRSYRLAVGNRQKQREGYDIGGSDEEDLEDAPEPPPPNYTCHRCGMVGGKPESHWIWECPTNDDPNHTKKVRTAKGIPRQFLRKVASVEEGQELSAGGVTFTLPGHSGHYIVSHESTYEDKKLRVGDTLEEKVVTAFTDGAKKVGESLKCPLCHQIFRQAILAPCCGATFCSDCIVDRLAHGSVDNSRCPGCGKEVYAHQLIANEDIRKQVEQISKASKAVVPTTQKPQEQRSNTIGIAAALKDRINRPHKHSADTSAAAPLALTAAPWSETAAGGGTGVKITDAAPQWQPLGIAPLLVPEHFAMWKMAVRSGVSPQAKEQFESWQKQTRANAPLPPSRESFEEWQKQLREGKIPQGTPFPGAVPMPSPDSHSPGRDRKRRRRDRS